MIFGRGKTTCRRARNALSDYIDGRLADEEREAVEHHLERCAGCTREIESLRSTVEILHQVPDVALPRSFVLREAEVESEAPAPQRRGGWLRPVPVMAMSHTGAERLSMLDPQRTGWLRPATALATAALVVVLMVDFLGAVPQQNTLDDHMMRTAPTLASPAPGSDAGGGVYGAGNQELSESPPAPAPILQDKALGGEAWSNEGAGLEDDAGVMENTGGTSPVVRQIEIGLGALVVFLFALVMYGLWRRRRWVVT
jgi:anti-sigma factor RsiW